MHRDGPHQRHVLRDQGDCKERLGHRPAVGKFGTLYAGNRARCANDFIGCSERRADCSCVECPGQHRRIAYHRLYRKDFHQQRHDVVSCDTPSIGCTVAHHNGPRRWHFLCNQGDRQKRLWYQPAIGECGIGCCCDSARQADSRSGRQRQRPTGRDVGGSGEYRRLADHQLSREVFEQQRFFVDAVSTFDWAYHGSFMHRDGPHQQHVLRDQGDRQKRHWHKPAVVKLRTGYARDTAAGTSAATQTAGVPFWTGHSVGGPNVRCQQYQYG